MKRNLPLIVLLFISGISLVSESALAQAGTPPAYCRPCLFYGGDFDASNPAANALANGFLYQGPAAATYVPFVVPSNQVWTVTGVFSNNMSNSTFLDPASIKWSISTGISTGNPGKVVAQGTIHATYIPTGRTWSIYSEYTALGHLNPQTAVTLTGGIYWVTAIPVCTDPSCGFAHFYLSDVEDVPAPNHKGIEPSDDSFLLSPDDGWFFAPTWGPTGVCGQNGEPGCDKFSIGLLGFGGWPTSAE